MFDSGLRRHRAWQHRARSYQAEQVVFRSTSTSTSTKLIFQSHQPLINFSIDTSPEDRMASYAASTLQRSIEILAKWYLASAICGNLMIAHLRLCVACSPHTTTTQGQLRAPPWLCSSPGWNSHLRIAKTTCGPAVITHSRRSMGRCLDHSSIVALLTQWCNVDKHYFWTSVISKPGLAVMISV
jgi:hypothetical protein